MQATSKGKMENISQEPKPQDQQNQPSTKIEIEAENLNFFYSQKQALYSINLKVPEK